MSLPDIAFVFAFVAILWISIALSRCAGISLRRFSIPSLLVVVYIIVAYIGILPLYFGWDEERVALGVVDRTVILTMFIYSAVTLLLIIAGFIFAHRYLSLNCSPFGSRRLQATLLNERLVFLILVLISVCVLLLYLKKVPSIALLATQQGGIGAGALARNQMSTTFSGTYWHYQLFFGPMLQLSCVFFYADYRMTRKFVAGMLFICVFAVAAFASLMTIEKGPFVKLLFALYLTYAITRGGNYWQPAAKYISILVLVALVLMYMLFLGVTSPAAGVAQAAFRILTGQIAPAYFYVDIFPRAHPFLYGASFPNPGGLLPFTSFDLTRFVSSYMYPVSTNLGMIGTAPTVFWAEMYANFGTIGVLVAPFPVGVLVYFIHHELTKFLPTATTVAAWVVVADNLSTLARTSLSEYLIDTTLFAVLAVTVIALGTRRARARRSVALAAS
jgi:hypothetical protein